MRVWQKGDEPRRYLQVVPVVLAALAPIFGRQGGSEGRILSIFAKKKTFSREDRSRRTRLRGHCR